MITNHLYDNFSSKFLHASSDNVPTSHTPNSIKRNKSDMISSAKSIFNNFIFVKILLFSLFLLHGNLFAQRIAVDVIIPDITLCGSAKTDSISFSLPPSTLCKTTDWT